MIAVVLREAGSVDNLRIEERPDPEPGPDEVVVRLRAAALNHRDVWICQGKYPGLKLPAVLGSDGAGQVEALGDNVDWLRIDQDVVINPSLDWGHSEAHQGPKFRILGMPEDGTFAERVKVPAANVVPKPAGLTLEKAAAIPLAGLTAYRAVVTKAHLKPGETALITGIGGGVSTFALLFAKALGAHVLVTSRSDAKLERAKALGAEGGANVQNGDWGQAILDQGGPPDVVIDSVGGETLAKAVELAKPGARLVTYGATTGPPPKLDLFRVFWKQLQILGTTMGTPAEFAALFEWFEDDSLEPVIDEVFPLTEAVEAHRRMERGEQLGKIVLRID